MPNAPAVPIRIVALVKLPRSALSALASYMLRCWSARMITRARCVAASAAYSRSAAAKLAPITVPAAFCGSANGCAGTQGSVYWYAKVREVLPLCSTVTTTQRSPV